MNDNFFAKITVVYLIAIIIGIIALSLVTCATQQDREKCKMLKENFFYNQSVECDDENN